jgi:hypothetical protein
MDSLAVDALVDAEVAKASDPALVEVMGRYRVAPRLVMREWGCAADASLPCWIVIEHAASNTGVCYSEHGFGPRCPWGLLWIEGRPQDMRDESGWFTTSEDAVRDLCIVE